MMISAKSLKNPQFLSTILSKLNNYGDNEAAAAPSSVTRLPKLDETLDEETFEEILEENDKKKK
jgi:hypothetical protein